MKIPLSYSMRNLLTRRMTTLLTASGMALVVMVFAATLMLTDGLQKTLVATGSPDNVIVIRKGAQTEVQSGVERQQANLVESLPGIAIGSDGSRLLAKELVVLINLPKRGSNKPSNVVIRGTSPASLALRPQVRLVEGRMPRSGSSEIMTGSGIARRFQGTGIGEHLRFGMRDWTVVGIFDGG
ncbi:MAG: ABC transporter permease, partial [Desulfuromonadales bacterium]